MMSVVRSFYNDPSLVIRGRRGTDARGCDYNASVVGSFFTWGIEVLFIYIFISFALAPRPKARIDFRHTTKSTELGNGVFKHKVPSAYPTICNIQSEADLI